MTATGRGLTLNGFSIQATHLTHKTVSCVAKRICCTVRNQCAARDPLPLASVVEPPERPPGYLQRPKRIKKKPKTSDNEATLPAQPAGPQLQQQDNLAQDASVQFVNGGVAESRAWEIEQLQDSSQQQRLLIQQHRKLDSTQQQRQQPVQHAGQQQLQQPSWSDAAGKHVQQHQPKQQLQQQLPKSLHQASSFSLQQPTGQLHSESGQVADESSLQSVDTTATSSSSSLLGSLHTLPFEQQPDDPNSSSSRHQAAVSQPPAGGAYSVVPTATAPSVAAAAARAAARTTARAQAATAAASSPSSSSSSTSLPPAEQCVPQQFWGLMREELRPWHKQVLIQLCYCLPPPACYIYRDMRAGTMQGVLAQRAMLEKSVRQCLTELMWQQKRLRGWLDMVAVPEGGYVSSDSLQQAEKEVLELKATIGRVKKQLQQLQIKAQAYSDTDYCQYSDQFKPLLQQMDELCDTAREEQIGLIHEIQGTRDRAARRVLYRRSGAAAAAVGQDVQGLVQQKLNDQQLVWKLVRRQIQGLRHRMQGRQDLAGHSRVQEQPDQGSKGSRDQGFGDGDDVRVLKWRYPPAEYILWRSKGRVGASRPPVVMPGLSTKMPQARHSVAKL